MEPEEQRDKILKEAFGYHKILVTYAYGLLRDYAMAEDAVQNGYVALTKRSETIIGDSVLAWCRGAVRFEALKLIRKQRGELSTDESIVFDAVSDAFEIEQTPDREAMRKERQTRLRLCIGKLPERSQLLVSGRYFKGLKLHELADAMSMSQEAVRKSLYRARASLRDCMTRERLPTK